MTDRPPGRRHLRSPARADTVVPPTNTTKTLGRPTTLRRVRTGPLRATCIRTELSLNGFRRQLKTQSTWAQLVDEIGRAHGGRRRSREHQTDNSDSASHHTRQPQTSEPVSREAGRAGRLAQVITTAGAASVGIAFHAIARPSVRTTASLRYETPPLTSQGLF